MPARRDVEIISFSGPRGSARELDRLCRDIGYTARSELIRDAIRMLARSEARLDTLSGRVEGVLMALYEHRAEAGVFEIKHASMDVVRSHMHSDFRGSDERCCDVLFFSGQAKRIRELVRKLESRRGVLEVRVFLA